MSPHMKLKDWVDINKLNWHFLSNNKNAIGLLEQNMDKISWYNLSFNENAIYILEQNIDKISWNALSENPNGIRLLEQNIDIRNTQKTPRIKKPKRGLIPK